MNAVIGATDLSYTHTHTHFTHIFSLRYKDFKEREKSFFHLCESPAVRFKMVIMGSHCEPSEKV